MGSISQNAPTLVELAEEILSKAKQLQSAVPQSPTFFDDTLSGLPDDTVRKELISLTERLNALARGANGFNFSRISRLILAPYDAMSVRVIYHFRIAQHVPLDTSISFTALAKGCKVDEKLLTRILRHAMVLHLFHEPEEGYVAHTIDSRLLATDPDLFDSVGCYLEDMGVGCQHLAAAMEKWPGSDERNHSACCYAYGTEMPFYAYIHQFPERMKRFSSMMRWVGESQAGSQTQITALYPWEDLGEGTVIDMGGGHGQVITPVARAYPSLRFIVQDLPGASEQGIRAVAADAQLVRRIDFMAHDFRLEQPVKDADAYLICQCITNWSDRDLQDIFRQLIPALKPGARVLVCDRKWQALGKDSDVDVLEHHRVDMIVLVNTNGRVRKLEEILKVFEMADLRFKFKKLHTVKGSPFMVCEMIWEP